MSRRPVALFVSALCLAGCARGGPPEALGRYAAGSVLGDDAGPLVALPAHAGRVVEVRRRVFANGYVQEIVLEGARAIPGENLIVVSAVTTARPAGAGEELALSAPSDADVASEMAARLPGIAMRVAPVAAENVFGRFGYATGARGRLACVYAWQYRAPARPLSLFDDAADPGALPVAIRVRLCGEARSATLLDELRALAPARAGATQALAPTGREAALGPIPAGGDVGAGTVVGGRGAALAGGSAATRRAEPRLRRMPHSRAGQPPRATHRAADEAGRDGFRLPLPGDVAPALVASAPSSSTPPPTVAADLPLPR